MYQKAKKAVLTLQRCERGRKARKLFKTLLEEKRQRERKRNNAAITIQKFTRGYAARKVFKVTKIIFNTVFKIEYFKIKKKRVIVVYH